ncbi:hypothetical protein HAX54_036462, partial [Datura stramonium]|nr:hypothetical protein [Datura stramonium]
MATIFRGFQRREKGIEMPFRCFSDGFPEKKMRGRGRSRCRGRREKKRGRSGGWVRWCCGFWSEFGRALLKNGECWWWVVFQPGSGWYSSEGRRRREGDGKVWRRRLEIVVAGVGEFFRWFAVDSEREKR